MWIANLHAQVWSEEQAQLDAATAAVHVSSWADKRAGHPGGDFNTRAPRPPGLTDLGGHKVDRILAPRVACGVRRGKRRIMVI